MSYDKLKQLEELAEALRKTSNCLIGHNGDCYCDFCEDDNTKNFRNKVIDLWWEVELTRRKESGEYCHSCGVDIQKDQMNICDFCYRTENFCDCEKCQEYRNG